MRKQYLALIAVGSLVVLGVVALVVGLTRPAPDLPNPLTPVVVGEPHPTLPAQPISQTIQGYTVTLVPIYADANRITLTYIVAGPPGGAPYSVTVGDFDTPAPHLTLHNGTLELSWRREAGDTFVPGGFDATTRQMVYRPATLVFAGIPDGNTWIPMQLHLALPLRISDDLSMPPEPTAVTPALIPPTLRPGPPPLLLPFAFDFVVRNDPLSRIIYVPQSMTSAGMKITLEWVEVTASETRLMLRYELIGEPANQWDLGSAAGTLLVGTEAIPFGDTRGLQSVEPCDPDRRCLYSYTAASLLYQPAAWTLRLDRLLLGGPHQPPSLSGLWEFSFTLPPAGSKWR